MSSEKNLRIDYLGCIAAKGLAFIIQRIPLSWGLFIGRLLGRLAYWVSGRRRRITLANLRRALGKEYPPQELRRISRRVFEHLGMNLADLLRFPNIDKKFIAHFVQIENLEYVETGLKQGRGLIFLTAHFGNWELSALTVSMSGYPLQVLAREQKHSRLNAMLNSYRSVQGSEVVPKGMAVRHVFKSLKENHCLGMLSDQDAGVNGLLVDFFGGLASTSVGPVDVALRTGAVIIPVFMVREKVKFHRLIFSPPLNIGRTADRVKDIKAGLEQYNQILESYIRKYPNQYLWAHKRWKTTPQRRIVILTDGKAGHLRQCRGVSELLKEIICEAAKKKWPDLEKNGLEAAQGSYQDLVQCQVVEVEFKSRTSKFMLGWLTRLGWWCPGFNMNFLKYFLKESSYARLSRVYGDFIVSCGSGAEMAGYLLAKENNAKSAHVLKPAYLPAGWFDLCLIPWHDNPRAGKHVLSTLIAPSTITLEGIRKQAQDLKKHIPQWTEGRRVISVFVGGSTQEYELNTSWVTQLCRQLKNICPELNTQLLITTSRRTSNEAEQVLTEQFKRYEPCKLLIIANRRNIEGAVEGMLGLSDLAIVTEDSISMVSEAVSSGRPVIAVKVKKKQAWTKHQMMLKKLQEENYLVISEIEGLSAMVKKLIAGEPAKGLDERARIKNALKRLL